MEFLKLKKELQIAIEQAEEVAIGYIADGVVFSPYIFTQDKTIRKILSDSLDEAIEIATEQIEGMEYETVVLVFNDNISLKDGDIDVIVSQVYNDDEDSAYSFGLGYKIENGNIKFLNKRISLGDVRNCLIY